MDLLLQLAQLRLFKPFVLLLDALDLRHLLLQHAGADLAHFCAPLLPGLQQIMMKTLRFLPFGAVQPHHFSSGNSNSSSPQTMPRLHLT